MAKKDTILKEWEEQISKYPKLDIESAKILYNKIFEEKDEETKKVLFNELINGTLYVVLGFVERNKLYIIKTPKYDLEDIINACNELWISAIKDGALLDVRFFSEILDEKFCAKLSSALSYTDFTVSDLTLLTTKDFYVFLYDFIERDKINGSVSYEEFCKAIVKYYECNLYGYYSCCSSKNAFRLSDSAFARQTYELALNIIDALKDENDDIELTKLKIRRFQYLFIEAGFERFRIDNDRVYQTDFSDSLVNNIVEKELVDAVLSCEKLGSRKKDILIKLFGLNGNPECSRKEVTDMYRISNSRLSQLVSKSCEILKNNPGVQKYR